MPKRKPVEHIEGGWSGFPSRLRFAFETRKREWGWTQNRFARAANYDDGAFSRLLSADGGTWEGIQCNTLLAFARVLRVEPLWLLSGQEPTGLSLKTEETPVPPSDVRESQPAIKVK